MTPLAARLGPTSPAKPRFRASPGRRPTSASLFIRPPGQSILCLPAPVAAGLCPGPASAAHLRPWRRRQERAAGREGQAGDQGVRVRALRGQGGDSPIHPCVHLSVHPSTVHPGGALGEGACFLSFFLFWGSWGLSPGPAAVVLLSCPGWAPTCSAAAWASRVLAPRGVSGALLCVQHVPSPPF